jgi:uncharacterized damage-inducible protein DinB
MNWIQHFTQELRKGHESEPWHGPSTKALLDGLTPEEAASFPEPEAHSIWEIVLHMDAWQREVIRRLDSGFVPEVPEEGDWRPVLVVSNAAWERAVDLLDSSLHELIRKLQTISESSFSDERGRTSGPSTTLAAMLSGLLQHNAYHSGQIAMLRRVILKQREERQK